MQVTYSAKVLMSAAIALSIFFVLATALTFEESRDRSDRAADDHGLYGHHLHASLGNAMDLDARGSLPEPGSVLPGGEMVSHFKGGRGEKALRGTGGGRTIYTGTGSWEPTLGIDSKGNIFFQGTNYGFELKMVVSRDGGRSWDEITPPTHTHTMDPIVYLDKRTDRAFRADLTWPCITVSHTDDVGASWTTSEACGLTDHQNLFTGPPVSSPTIGYPNIVYMCAIDGGAGTGLSSTATSCLKSLDGGITWLRTGAPAYTAEPLQHDQGTHDIAGFCDGGTGPGFVDSKGVVYLPRGWCGQPYLAISKNEGATWERIQVADNGMPQSMGQLCVPICTEGIRFQHEAAVAVDAKSNIYYFWTARDRLPYLAVSRDEGRSFSKPIMIGPPGIKEAWGPTIDIGANGKVAVAYVGSTNAPGGKAPDGEGPEYTDDVTWNGYITSAVNALSKKPRFFTASVNVPSDPIVRGECGGSCSVQVHFIDVVIGPNGRPYTSMVDECRPPGDVCEDFLGFVGTVVGGPKLR